MLSFYLIVVDSNGLPVRALTWRRVMSGVPILRSQDVWVHHVTLVTLLLVLQLNLLLLLIVFAHNAHLIRSSLVCTILRVVLLNVQILMSRTPR